MSPANPPDPVGQQPKRLVPLARSGRLSRVDLPRPLTSFIGRDREVATVGAALRRPGVRLVTLIGPGGVGKTRLAMRVAEELADDPSHGSELAVPRASRPESLPRSERGESRDRREGDRGIEGRGQAFADGVWFVPLAPVHDPALVAPAIARELGVRDTGGRSIIAALQTFLHDRQALLILDNFEHVLDAAPLATDLLAACPRLSILATSRAVLRLSGEHDLVVPPLAVPDPAHSPSLDEVDGAPAVRLFVERARAAGEDFALNADNATAVAQICHRLDGLPLAIELAAAQTRLLAPAALLARLDRRLPLLTGGPRDAPARLQTMRAAIAWSHDLLSPEEQTLFRRLAVFVGGFTLDAADIVGRGQESEPVPSVLDLLASLIEKTLIWRQTTSPGDAGTDRTRFWMLETIREFGLEQLADSGEEAVTWSRHAAHASALAEEAEPHLRELDQVAWLDRIEAELPNLRAALTWLRDAGHTARGLRLAAALWTFWVVRDHVPEGRRWLETFLTADDEVARLQALVAIGDMAERQGDYAAAAASIEAALDLARKLGDRAGEASALRILGNVSIASGEVARYERGDDARASVEFARAVTCLEHSVALARELDDDWGAAKASHWLATVLGLQGNAAGAIARLEETVAAFHRLGDQRQLCNVYWNLGWTAHGAGEQPRARTAFAESLTLARRLGYHWFAGLCLVGLAEVAVDSGQADRAARLLGAASALREATGEPLRPSVRANHDRAVESARAVLGEATFVAAWEAGATSPPDTAITEALAWASDSPVAAQAQPATHPHHRLSPRELDVLRLLVEGKSDKEIATTLAIARPTASNHVAAILAKLGVPSRSAAAAYAVRQRLF